MMSTPREGNSDVYISVIRTATELEGVVSDYMYFANTDTLRIKTLVDDNDSDTTFGDALDESTVEAYVHIVIEKVASSDVLAAY